MQVCFERIHIRVTTYEISLLSFGAFNSINEQLYNSLQDFHRINEDQEACIKSPCLDTNAS